MKNWYLLIGLLFCSGAHAQVIKQDSIPEAEVLKVVKDTLRPVLKEVLRPDVLAELEESTDSIPVTIKTGPYQPVPKKSAIYSLLLPGMGQIYNRDYWKLPFVYAGLGGAVYMISWNSVRYQDFLKPYLSSYNKVTGVTTKERIPVYIRGEDEFRELTVDQIKRGKTFYRRFKGYGFVVLGLTYALAAVEANVAAHLKNFNANMNEDLTLKLEPSNERTLFSQSAPGVKLVLAF